MTEQECLMRLNEALDRKELTEQLFIVVKYITKVSRPDDLELLYVPFASFIKMEYPGFNIELSMRDNAKDGDLVLVAPDGSVDEQNRYKLSEVDNYLPVIFSRLEIPYQTQGTKGSWLTRDFIDCWRNITGITQRLPLQMIETVGRIARTSCPSKIVLDKGTPNVIRMRYGDTACSVLVGLIYVTFIFPDTNINIIDPDIDDPIFIAARDKLGRLCGQFAQSASPTDLFGAAEYNGE